LANLTRGGGVQVSVWLRKEELFAIRAIFSDYKFLTVSEALRSVLEWYVSVHENALALAPAKALCADYAAKLLGIGERATYPRPSFSKARHESGMRKVRTWLQWELLERSKLCQRRRGSYSLLLEDAVYWRLKLYDLEKSKAVRNESIVKTL